MAYTLTSWVDSPTRTTEFNATNMLRANTAITDLDSRVGVLETSGAPLALNTQTGTSYTLVIGDAGKVVEMNNASANTLTIPPNSSVAFPIGSFLTVRQYGAGATTLTPGAGVTLRSFGSALVTAGQYAEATLSKRGTDEWVVSGQVTP